jgi:hypothetical protein
MEFGPRVGNTRAWSSVQAIAHIVADLYSINPVFVFMRATTNTIAAIPATTLIAPRSRRFGHSTIGYRAQFAYPRSLVLPSNIDPRLETFCLESLMVYGADLCIPSNVPLWTKGSGYASAGLDWQAERRKPWCDRCEKRHEHIVRTVQLDDAVMLLGRGIGSVERNDRSGRNSDTVYVRFRNKDLYIVPFDDLVWAAEIHGGR